MLTDAQKEAAQNLLAALSLMNDSGAHWTKGQYEVVTATKGALYCSVGAVRKAVVASSHAPFTYTGPEIRALAAVIVEFYPEFQVELERKREGLVLNLGWHDVIVKWNDADERTWPEVVRVFKETARRLKNQELVVS